MPNQKYASCIEACNACADACDFCAASCLQEEDVKAMARCIAMDMDCAQICRLAVSYMARGSELYGPGQRIRKGGLPAMRRHLSGLR